MERLEQANGGETALRPPVPPPTRHPHPVPGGEYDRDGFLYKCPVENLIHHRIAVDVELLLRPHVRRLHGDRALVVGDCGLYPKRADRHARPLVPDLLVSLTAGDIGAPDTPPREDRFSYKLWQEPVPDLVLEIVSKSSGERDTVDKPNRYEAVGIPEYWIFDPLRVRIGERLGGRLLAGGRYRHAEPRAPSRGEAPLPAGAVGYWSDVLGLYLYAEGDALRLHHPQTGRLRDLAEEADVREAEEAERRAAEAERDTERSARQAAEAERKAAEAERDTERSARQAAEAERDAAKSARQAAEARAAALEAELRELRRGT